MVPGTFFGKSEQTHILRSVGALAFGHCAVYAPGREILQNKMRKQFVGYFQKALAQERHLPALHSVYDALLSFSDAFRATSETTRALLFLPELLPRMTKIWGTNQTSFEPRSIEMLENASTSRLQQFQCAHLARNHTSSRAKVPPAGSMLALHLYGSTRV